MAKQEVMAASKRSSLRLSGEGVVHGVHSTSDTGIQIFILRCLHFILTSILQPYSTS